MVSDQAQKNNFISAPSPQHWANLGNREWSILVLLQHWSSPTPVTITSYTTKNVTMSWENDKIFLSKMQI